MATNTIRIFLAYAEEDANREEGTEADVPGQEFGLVVSDEEVRQYFTLPKVLEGLFHIIETVFEAVEGGRLP